MLDWAPPTLSKYLLLARLRNSRYRIAVDPSCEYIMAVNALPGSLVEKGSSSRLSENRGKIARAPGFEFQTRPSRVPSQDRRSRTLWRITFVITFSFDNKHFKRIESSHLEHREYYFLNRWEITLPEKLRLLPESEDLVVGHGSDDIGNLKQKPLIREHDCLGPVNFIMKRQCPTVAEYHWYTTGPQGLQKSKAAQSTSTRNETKRRVHQQNFVVVPTERRENNLNRRFDVLEPSKNQYTLGKLTCRIPDYPVDSARPAIPATLSHDDTS